MGPHRTYPLVVTGSCGIALGYDWVTRNIVKVHSLAGQRVSICPRGTNNMTIGLEPPIKTTKLGSYWSHQAGHHLCWVWCQLDNHGLPAGRPHQLGGYAPNRHALRAVSWQVAYPARRAHWVAMGGLAKRVHCSWISGCKWWLLGGGYFWRLRHTRSLVPLRGLQVQRVREKMGGRPREEMPFFEETHPLAKRHASSHECEGRPSSLFPYKCTLPPVF
ncbi:hypothetical protein Cgig2_000637 [Carnegiea gigantea]|uniref:Uncharacterized protein n=1 Tax=Carnegiea gigantea TaxID=171969 RepID=A0A9Q1JLN7_9CARY|nr:hypothetical protein Cgig2_000637 [Carnegiea gigantea]